MIKIDVRKWGGFESDSDSDLEDWEALQETLPYPVDGESVIIDLGMLYMYPVQANEDYPDQGRRHMDTARVFQNARTLGHERTTT